jgi:hypothetical protein
LRFSAATADEIYPVGKFEKVAKRGKRSHRRRITGVENGPQRDHKPTDVALHVPQSAGPAAQMGDNAHVQSRVGRPKLPVYVNGANDKS